MSNTATARTEYFAGRRALYDRIDGRVHDADTAVLIGETSNNNEFSPSDYGFWKAGLFRTPRSGRYFIAGVGGAMTRFSYLHDDEATEWAWEHLGIDLAEPAAA